MEDKWEQFQKNVIINLCVFCRRSRPRQHPCGLTSTGNLHHTGTSESEDSCSDYLTSHSFQSIRGFHQPLLWKLPEPCSVSTGFFQTPGALDQLLRPLEPTHEASGSRQKGQRALAANCQSRLGWEFRQIECFVIQAPDLAWMCLKTLSFRKAWEKKIQNGHHF